MRIKGLIGGAVVCLAICGATARAQLRATTQLTVTPSTTRPDVPRLKIGERSFVVDGVAVLQGTQGFRFEILSDLAGQRFAFADLEDGTPLFLSDGQRTLVYDATHKRVVLLPNSHGYIRMIWKHDETIPMSFDFGVQALGRASKTKELLTEFGFDAFPAEADVKEGRLVSEGKTNAFALEFVPGGFRLTVRKYETWLPMFEVNATRIGQPIPASRRAFPDLAKLKASGVPLYEPEGAELDAFNRQFAKGGVMIDKLVYILGETARGSLEKATPGGVDWNLMRRNDTELGPIYRAALAEQGIAFPALAAPAK